MRLSIAGIDLDEEITARLLAKCPIQNDSQVNLSKNKFYLNYSF
jgi:hypothetical protein